MVSMLYLVTRWNICRVPEQNKDFLNLSSVLEDEGHFQETTDQPLLSENVNNQPSSEDQPTVPHGSVLSSARMLIQKTFSRLNSREASKVTGSPSSFDNSAAFFGPDFADFRVPGTTVENDQNTFEMKEIPGSAMTASTNNNNKPHMRSNQTSQPINIPTNRNRTGFNPANQAISQPIGVQINQKRAGNSNVNQTSHQFVGPSSYPYQLYNSDAHEKPLPSGSVGNRFHGRMEGGKNSMKIGSCGEVHNIIHGLLYKSDSVQRNISMSSSRHNLQSSKNPIFEDDSGGIAAKNVQFDNTENTAPGASLVNLCCSPTQASDHIHAISHLLSIQQFPQNDSILIHPADSNINLTAISERDDSQYESDAGMAFRDVHGRNDKDQQFRDVHGHHEQFVIDELNSSNEGSTKLATSVTRGHQRRNQSERQKTGVDDREDIRRRSNSQRVDTQEGSFLGKEGRSLKSKQSLNVHFSVDAWRHCFYISTWF